MSRPKKLFEKELKEAEAQNLRRELKELSTAQGSKTTVDDSDLINFSSNDYLGLANHPALVVAAFACAQKYGWGSGASRLISGSFIPHRELEEYCASFLGHEAALLYGSGYSANTGALTALLGKDDTVFADRLTHASLLDGVRWSGAKLIRFDHNDTDDLSRRIEKEKIGRGKIAIVTEGVFSMDGDKAPLAKIADIADRCGAILIVDDAHGFGLFGEKGKGVVDEAGVTDRVGLHIVTFGKSAGASGGIVAGSRSLIDGLINFSRAFIYSTAPPPATAAAAMAGLEIINSEKGDMLRSSVMANVAAMNDAGKKFLKEKSETPILPFYLPGEIDVFDVSKRLREAGFYAPAIRPPTVPKGLERLRVSVTAAHSKEDCQGFVEALTALINSQK